MTTPNDVSASAAELLRLATEAKTVLATRESLPFGSRPWVDANNAWLAALQTMEDACEPDLLISLCAALEEAQRDTARLRWIERFGFTIQNENTSLVGEEEYSVKWCDENGGEHEVDEAPLRQVIDKAMADQQRNTATLKERRLL